MYPRTLKQAMKSSDKLKEELPHLIQPDNSDYDMVVLADEVKRLQAIEKEKMTDKRRK